MSAKIAPRLWALIVKNEVSDLAEDWPGQRSELRSLRAVVRAARRHVADYYDALPLGASSDPLVKALERMDRASRWGAKGEP